jgi:hypothetical protein
LALGLEEHTQTKQYATTVSHYVFKRWISETLI